MDLKEEKENGMNLEFGGFKMEFGKIVLGFGNMKNIKLNQEYRVTLRYGQTHHHLIHTSIVLLTSSSIAGVILISQIL